MSWYENWDGQGSYSRPRVVGPADGRGSYSRPRVEGPVGFDGFHLSIAAADVSGDGAPDVLVSYYTLDGGAGKIVWFENQLALTRPRQRRGQPRPGQRS